MTEAPTATHPVVLAMDAMLADPAIIDRAVYLRARWADEQQYEDLNEYAVALDPLLAAHGWRVSRMLRSPFGFRMEPTDAASTSTGWTITVRVRARSIEARVERRRGAG
jgi:hypothetical protein